MSLVALLSLGALVVYLLMGLYVLAHDPRAALNRVFFLVCMAFTLWALGYVIAHQAGDEHLYWIGYHIGALGWSVCTSLLLHFFLLLTKNRWATRTATLLALYVPAAFFLIASARSHFVVKELQRTALGWVEVVDERSPLLPVFIVYYMGYLLLGLALCVLWGRRTRAVRERKQAALVVGTGVLGMGAITVCELILPLMGRPVPVLSPVLVLVWALGIAVAMLRYELMTLTPATAANEILRTMVDALVICDLDQRILVANEAARRLLPSVGELVGRPLHEVVPQLSRLGDRDLYEALAQAPVRNHECVLTGAPRAPSVALSCSATLIRDRDGNAAGAVVVLRDVTELRQAQDNLEHLAHHDTLTGLPNRLLLQDRLAQAMARAVRYRTCVGLMLLDLDGFKKVNDVHGHATGDKLLCLVAERLRAAVRTTDSVGRLGGDEFLAILPDLQVPRDAAAVAARILDAFARGTTIDGLALDVGTSIGIAVFPADAREAEELLRDADQAMYRSKSAGGRGFRFFGAGASAEDEPRATA